MFEVYVLIFGIWLEIIRSSGLKNLCFWEVGGRVVIIVKVMFKWCVEVYEE